MDRKLKYTILYFLQQKAQEIAFNVAKAVGTVFAVVLIFSSVWIWASVIDPMMDATWFGNPLTWVLFSIGVLLATVGAVFLAAAVLGALATLFYDMPRALGYWLKDNWKKATLRAAYKIRKLDDDCEK